MQSASRLQFDSASGETRPIQRSSLRFGRNIIVSRPIFSQARFDSGQEFGEYGLPTSPWGKLKRSTHHKIDALKEWHPQWKQVVLGFLMTTFPILGWLRHYSIKQDLLKDTIAGLTVGIMNIPQGMAYALLAGMPAVFGLYTSFFPLLVYTIMSTSRHVSFGTFAVVSIMTGKVIAKYGGTSSINVTQSSNTTGNAFLAHVELDDSENDDLESKVAVAIALTTMVGIWQTLMGLLGLGYLSVYLSDQLVKGFTTGAAFHVFTSQVKPVLGLRGIRTYNGPLNLFFTYRDIFQKIDTIHIPTVILSAVCLVFLITVKFSFNDNNWVQKRLPLRFPIPSELIIVVCGAFASYHMGLKPIYNVSVIGNIPLGMPQPRVPDLSLVTSFAMDSFAIAIVSFAITFSLAKLFASKYKYTVDSNQELRAMGCSNIFSGFFQCIPSTGSLGRTAVQTSVGGQTQLVSIIAAGLVLVVLLAVGQYLEPLPNACLGCIIMVALIGLLKQVAEIPNLWKISASDTSVFVVSLLAVILLDVDIGLAAAVGWSLLTVVFRTQVPDVSLLGRALGTDIYKRADVYKSAAEVDGCKIIRFDAPLYFANADYFSTHVRSLAKLDHKTEASHHKGRTRVRSKDSESSSSQHSEEYSHASNKRIISAELKYYPEKENVPSTVDAATWTADYFEQPVKYVIIDCSSMCFVDINGIKVIKEFAADCHELSVKLLLAACKANMREFLALCGFTEDLNGSHIFVTVHDAVMQAVKEMQEKNSVHVSEVEEDASQYGWKRERQFLSQPILSAMDETEGSAVSNSSILLLPAVGNGRERKISSVSATQTDIKKLPTTIEKWIKNSDSGKKT